MQYRRILSFLIEQLSAISLHIKFPADDLAHIPHLEVSHYELWEFGEIGVVIALNLRY